MNAFVINMAASMLLKMVTKETVAEWTKFGLDQLEELVKSSENELDDTIILPLIQVVRAGYNLN